MKTMEKSKITQDIERYNEIVKKTDGPLTREQESRFLDKQLKDIQNSILQKFPNAKFDGGEIHDADIDEEEIEEYRKIWYKRYGS